MRNLPSTIQLLTLGILAGSSACAVALEGGAVAAPGWEMADIQAIRII